MVGKIDTIKRLRLFGDFLMLGSFLLLLWLFLSAYLSSEFNTTVHVNNYGEAHIEMIVLVFFLLPLFLFTTALSFIDWRQTWKARQKILSQKYLLTDAPSPYQECAEPLVNRPVASNGPVVLHTKSTGMRRHPGETVPDGTVSASLNHQSDRLVECRFPEEGLICPRCNAMFEVNRKFAKGAITCPTCGLRGTYVPEDLDSLNGKNDKPTVRIIKDIRR
ncbi:MAG: hypothetical protein V3U20_02950 [Thermoplasmata archaeon]